MFPRTFRYRRKEQYETIEILKNGGGGCLLSPPAPAPGTTVFGKIAFNRYASIGINGVANIGNLERRVPARLSSRTAKEVSALPPLPLLPYAFFVAWTHGGLVSAEDQLSSLIYNAAAAA